MRALPSESNAGLVQKLEQKVLELEQAHRDLAAREAHLRAVLDTEPVCVKLLRHDGTLLEMNPAGLLMLEADSIEQVANRSVLPFIVEEDRAAFRDLTKRVFAGDGGVLEFRIVGLKEGRRWLETNATPLRDASGQVTALLGITRDITARKEAERALRTAESRHQRLIESGIVGVVIADIHGQIKEANDLFLSMVGYERAELEAGTMLLDAIVLPEGRAVDTFVKHRLIEEGKCPPVEREYVHKNGHRIPLLQSVATLDGTPDECIWLFQDLTERKLALVRLQDAQSRLQFAVSAGRVGLWDWDLRTNLVNYSPEWKHQIGYDDEEISDDFDEWRSRVHPEDLPRALQTVEDYLRNDNPNYVSEFRFRHRDGSYIHILARGLDVRDADGTRIRLVGSHVDVTEFVQLRTQLLQTQKMESLGRLAGGVAHDFNNLLTVIVGFAGLALMELRAEDPLRENLQEIRRAADRAAVLTRQLLAFGRRQVQRLEVLNLNTVTTGVEGLLRRLIGEDIEVTLLLAEDLGNVRADAGQLEQVVMNLAVNSRDAMPTGGRLTIETRNVELDCAFAAEHPSVEPGPHVELLVSDTGSGMDDATRARVFEPFFTTKPPGKGTGLGLSMVYGIVKQNGGSIWAESEVGVGTTFRIYLPRVMEPESRRAPVSLPMVRRGRETILVVEDEESLRQLTVRVLRAASYNVMSASNGGEALMLVEGYEGTVHLTLTDVVMPGMSGRELATRLASIQPSMQVLYASGYTDDTILRHGVREETIHLINKPYTVDELTKKVREVLDSRPTAAQPSDQASAAS